MPLPYFNNRHLPRPASLPPFSRNTLKTQPDEATPRLLFAACRALCRKEFWTEAVALDRLRYKNTNQHSGALHFRRLLEVKRVLARVEEAAPDALLDELLTIMHPSRTARTAGPWELVPQKPYLSYILAKLVGCYTLLEQLTISLTTAYTYFQCMTAQTLFMAFGMTAMSSLARLHFLTEKMMNDVASTYDVVWKLMDGVPDAKSGTPYYAAQLPGKLDREFLKYLRGDLNTVSTAESPSDEVTEETDEYLPSQTTSQPAVDVSASISDDFWSSLGDEHHAVEEAKTDETSDVIAQNVNKPTTIVHLERTAESNGLQDRKRKEPTPLASAIPLAKPAKKKRKRDKAADDVFTADGEKRMTTHSKRQPTITEEPVAPQVQPPPSISIDAPQPAQPPKKVDKPNLASRIPAPSSILSSKAKKMKPVSESSPSAGSTATAQSSVVPRPQDSAKNGLSGMKMSDKKVKKKAKKKGGSGGANEIDDIFGF
ncbi:hypothetical protein HDV00_002048 [Rhizophlyctis rosea]|nr:hypothetical protein HDV00_002048 [Rhizophlyctis rosea]